MSPLALGWMDALLASLWQAPIVAVVAWLLELAFVDRARSRHAIRALALLSVPMLMASTMLGVLPGLLAGAEEMAWGSAPETTSATNAEADTPPWLGWTMVGWSLGVLAMILRVVGQWRAVERLRRSSLPLPAVWTARVRVLARRLGVAEPNVRLSPDCDSPMVLGLLRPMVLLPAGLVTGVPPAVLEAAIAHELMHLRRLDPWLHAAQVAIEVALFFNPAVWWLSRRMSVEREHACDEATVHALGRPALGYARALLELEQWRRQPIPALALGMGGVGLRARVWRLVRPRRVGAVGRWAARIGVVAVGVTLAAWIFAPSTERSSEGIDAVTPVWLPASVRRHELQIAEAAQRHGVDPSLLAIMVWAESRGRTDARSPAGARGLLQLMPSTAADIAERRGLPEPSVTRLDEPAYNLDMGAWYMARQIERYDDMALALAAYNAGPGRVAAYERGEAALPEETRRYQDTILALWRERALPWSPTLASRR